MSNPASPSPPITTGNPYAPQEPANILWLEHCSFAGNIIAGIFYGITLVLFFQCTHALLHHRYRKTPLHKMLLLLYVVIMFGLSTIFTAMNLSLMQRSYIDFRNYPQGPIGYSLFLYSNWRAVVPNACFIISNWMADGLLMYRCYIMYNMQKPVLVVPAIMYAASVSMGIITLYKSSRPESSLWSGVTVNFGLPYFSISVALNVILTLLISGRLFIHNRQLEGAVSTLGNSLYKRIIAMLIESCALYAVTSVLFIGPYAANNFASDIFLPILSQVQVIAPFLIILRVAKQSMAGNTSTVGGGTNSDVAFKVGSRPTDRSMADSERTMEIPLGSLKRERYAIGTDKSFQNSGDV